jgi:maleylpyruvate isomerase
LKLYGYFRSSAAYRLRIALNWKGLAVEHVPVHLRRGDQHSPEYLARNPQGLVPMLATDDGLALTQSLAIIEWLEETQPAPPLLPPAAAARARVRAIALVIACEIHPLNNLRVLKYLAGPLAQPESTRDDWYRHWCDVGLAALETQLAREPATGRYCHGDAPTLADVCLVPQLANARRVAVDLTRYPTLLAIEAACNDLPAFAAAHPARQPDAE